MNPQLIISKYDFINKINFSSSRDLDNYVLDYFDISTIFLRSLGYFAYRIQNNYILYGQKDPGNLLTHLHRYDFSCSTGAENPTYFPCFNLTSKQIITRCSEVKEIADNVSVYVGVLFYNYV